jgi:Zn-dependent peptidase ImmA (M78 family)
MAKTSLEEDSVIERQADKLASALLMPTAQVKRAFYRNRNADALALQFGVSRQAMSIFLRNHNLV